MSRVRVACIVTGYYRILVDPSAVDRWHLGVPIDESGREIDPRSFIFGRKFEGAGPLTITARRPGRPLDFNFGDFDMPVVRAAICHQLAAEAGTAVQSLPVTVEGKARDFEILNVVDLVDCVDEKTSKITKWREEDGRPEKVGEYRMFAKLMLDPRKAAGHKIFRVRDWEVPLIVEQEIKELLERRKTSGIVFQAVT